jgi:hypothetical protein
MVASDEGWTGDTVMGRESLMSLVEMYRRGKLGSLRVVDHGTIESIEQAVFRRGIIPSLWIAAGVGIAIAIIFGSILYALSAITIPVTVVVVAVVHVRSAVEKMLDTRDRLERSAQAVLLTQSELATVEHTQPGGVLDLVDARTIDGQLHLDGIGWRTGYLTFDDEHERVMFILNR